MNDGKRNIAYGRIAFILIGIVVSSVASFFFGERLENQIDILSFVATVFSILAGVVIAIISILGDPSMLLGNSWRKDFFAARETQRKLHRHTDIFILYVILLLTIFVFSLVKMTDLLYPYFQMASFFLICFSFWMSLSLPRSLKEIQRKRMEDAVAAKRRE
ncbi:MAG TPA: hypothetical protein VGV39_19770 [Mesorhizobium sp.]|jgi:uncharacterized membrane protein|uniref:hypothetical protein n=1 Tax=Mesorhizobium sp. TaxID=1871066 RepID=UPI002DDCD5F2|nr:hypothetical protein [Mesorhizobium sp.]HEV2505325.1 hypothetical protein [Mesorhizobium sp.]